MGEFLKKHAGKIFRFCVIVGAAVVTEYMNEKQKAGEIEEVVTAVIEKQKLEVKED